MDNPPNVNIFETEHYPQMPNFVIVMLLMYSIIGCDVTFQGIRIYFQG